MSLNSCPVLHFLNYLLQGGAKDLSCNQCVYITLQFLKNATSKNTYSLVYLKTILFITMNTKSMTIKHTLFPNKYTFSA